MATQENPEATGTSATSHVDHVMTEVVVDTSVSTASSASSDGADESAIQHLNIDYSDQDSAIGGMTPKYMLPNDEAEMDRLDLQHQLWLITLHDELQLAPITNPQNVLDIGTGTGIWAIEFANKHPSAKVIGSDLSPIQPQYIPANCQFEVDDAEDEWNYSQKFDLIHGRALVTCFKDPGTVISSAFEALTPGGYLELQDVILPLRSIDDTILGTSLQTFFEKTISSAASLGTSWRNSGNYISYFEKAGFVDIVEMHFQWPMNTWPKGERMKILGRYLQEDMLRGLESLSMAVLTRGGGMTKDEVLELTAEVRKDINNKSIHAYLPIVVVYGRKPQQV